LKRTINILLVLVFFFFTDIYGQEPIKSFPDSLRVFIDLQLALQNPDNVYRLKLKREHLKNIPAEVFSSFKNLQYLDLSKNSLTELPPEIGNLKNLKHLNLSKNKLSTLPPEIGKLESLKELVVNQNNIASLPDEIGDLKKLEFFDLWSNEITQFPPTISNLKKLKELDLRVILLDDDQQKAIKELVPHTKVQFSPGCNCGK